MRDLLAAYEQLSAGPWQVGRAVVTSVWGSATSDGSVVGSVSGGCVEAAAVGR
jgi:xanthine/CO dehydrogenase XdhC/CoxF family maturation factor